MKAAIIWTIKGRTQSTPAWLWPGTGDWSNMGTSLLVRYLVVCMSASGTKYSRHWRGWVRAWRRTHRILSRGQGLEVNLDWRPAWAPWPLTCTSLRSAVTRFETRGMEQDYPYHFRWHQSGTSFHIKPSIQPLHFAWPFWADIIWGSSLCQVSTWFRCWVATSLTNCIKSFIRPWPALVSVDKGHVLWFDRDS